MLALKMGAYLATDSHAIFSDAMESVVHIFATGFVVFSTYVSNRPADDDHPYGHGKIEGFSIGFEGGLIFLAGLSILWQALRGLWEGSVISNIDTGLWLIGASVIINLALGYYLINRGKKLHSDILIADGHHILSDVVTSVGVLVGVLMVRLTGWTPLDSIVAAGVAVHLLVVGGRLMNKAVSRLMDHVDPDTLKIIVDVLNQMRHEDWKDVHLLRVHRNGRAHHVDFHMLVPPDWSVAHAHHVMDAIEKAILRTLKGGGSVMIHLDPTPDPEYVRLLEKGEMEEGSPFTVASATRLVPDPEMEPFRNPKA